MTAYDEQTAAALEVARSLAGAGVPLFLAQPDPAAATGFRLPKGWQHTEPDPSVVDRWQPGLALCAVMGHGLDLADLDPRNASDGLDSPGLRALLPAAYGVAATPSGGLHLFVRSLGVHSSDGVLPGVDIKAGVDGKGHGFAFLAPTVRVSKVDGQPRPYRWIDPPDLAAIAAGPVAEGLADLVRQRRRRGAGASRATATATTVEEFLAQPSSPWGDVAGTLARVGRNRGVFELASSLRSTTDLTFEQALAQLDEQVWPLVDQEQGGHPFGREEYEATVRGVWERYEGGTAASPPAADFPPLPNLPEEFWRARPELEHIRQAAWSRGCSPDALLHAVLARVASQCSPLLRLDAGLEPASLNYYAALLGGPGTGKTTANSTARGLVPAPMFPGGGPVPWFLDSRPLGSGEGLAELFMERVSIEVADGKGGTKQQKVRRPVRRGALVFADEGESLAVMMQQRSGSTIAEALRRGWMGETLGQSNASEETTRVVPPLSYSLGVVIGFQFEPAAVLLDRWRFGDPQRFCFATATDPTMPPEQPRWPGPLHDPTELDWPGGVVFLAESEPIVVGFPTAVRTEIWHWRRRLVQGETVASALDEHWPLSRMKMAGLLALLAGRTEATEEDWALSAALWDTSCAARNAVLTYQRQRAAQAAQQKTESAVGRQRALDEDAHSRALWRVAAKVARRVHGHAGTHDDGWCTRRCLSQALAGRDREHTTVDEATEGAVSQGWLVAEGDRFRPGESKP
jgi:hypothetical protein